MPRKVAILIFEEVEVLDFSGPFEVFAVARDEQGAPLFEVYNVAETMAPVLARNGFSVNPHYTIDDCPAPDLLVIPGGRGTRTAMHNARLTAWIQQHSATAEHVLSVCTGALMLGTAGLLEGLAATTYHTAFDELAQVAPNTELRPGKRWVDNGKVITSAGVSAGIDMSLYVVGKLFGFDQAERTAKYMEYEHYMADHA
jgi:transcriptional regulator GlxA family with amidase domain